MVPQARLNLPTLTDGALTLRPREGAAAGVQGLAAFTIVVDAEDVGSCAVEVVDESTGRLSWSLEPARRGRGHAQQAVRRLVDWSLTGAGQGGLGLSRVEATVEAGHEAALRVATRSGLRREGVRRVAAPSRGDGPTGYVVLARLATDPPLSEPESFRALLNSFLPRKRAIAQVLVRDRDDRVLMCRLTYKRDWDLPGGVVEVGESPQRAAVREVAEELALDLPTGRLLLTDWLPPWSGWDDALCLVFDGGVHDASLADAVVAQPREIRSARFCTPAEVREHAADFTARRVEAALAALRGRGPSYTESGRG